MPGGRQGREAASHLRRAVQSCRACLLGYYRARRLARRHPRLSRTLQFAIAVSLAFLFEWQLAHNIEANDASNVLTKPIFDIASVYHWLVTASPRKPNPRFPTLIKLSPNTTPQGVSAFAVCQERAFIGTLLQSLAPAHPNVVVIDKYFGTHDCAPYDPGTNILRTGMQVLCADGAAIVIGREIDEKALQTQAAPPYPLTEAVDFSTARCVTESIINIDTDLRRVDPWWPEAQTKSNTTVEQQSLPLAAALAGEPSLVALCGNWLSKRRCTCLPIPVASEIESTKALSSLKRIKINSTGGSGRVYTGRRWKSGFNSTNSRKEGGEPMASRPYAHLLRTTPIPPQMAAATAQPAKRFGKSKRGLGDPVAAPKASPRFIPPPPTNLVNLSLALDVILPTEAKAAQDAGMLVFHAVGDTGGIHGDNVEKAISDAMDNQISAAQAAKQLPPAFYFNLGDVVYFNGESQLYMSQFYEPYQNYHAAIFAIAGNHDGDTQTRPGDPVDTEPSLFGFMRNFCDTTSHQDSPYRATMTQPYVHWTLETPFATIVGLYSNVDGNLDARGTSEQQQWFQDQVSKAASDRALIVTVHHPPYSLDTTHGGYPDIEIAIDRMIQATKRIPTAVLCGHIHSYQRFERALGSNKVPYIVAGAGGYANQSGLLHRIEKTAAGKPLPAGFQTTHPDLKLMTHNDTEPGFLRITLDAKKKTLTSDYFLVPFAGTPPPAAAFDTVTVPW